MLAQLALHQYINIFQYFLGFLPTKQESFGHFDPYL